MGLREAPPAARGGGSVFSEDEPIATDSPDDDGCGVTDGGCISFWAAGCGLFLAATARATASVFNVLPVGVGATWPSVIASISRSAFLSDSLVDIWRLAIISFWRCEIVTGT